MSNLVSSAGVGVDGKKISSPGHFVVNNITLYPHDKAFNRGKGVELKQIVSSIEILESITQSSILVKLGIGDSSNLLENLRISGNEKIHIHIYQDIYKPAIKKEINIEVFISDILDYAKPNVGAQTFEVQAVSKEALYNQLTTLNVSFKGSVTDLVKDICKSFLKKEKVDMTSEAGVLAGGGIMQGIYPNLKPFKAIKWLIRNGINDGSYYYFWDSLRANDSGLCKTKFQLYSYKEMIKQTPIETFNNIPFFKAKERTEENFYTAQLQKIKKISSNFNSSVFNNIAKGAYASKTITVDLSKKYVKEENFSYEDKKLEKSNAFPPFNKQVFEDQTLFEAKSSNIMYISANDNAFNDNMKNYHSQTEKNIKEAQSYEINSKSTSQRITLAGNPGLHAGGMVELRLIKAIDHEFAEGEKTLLDEYMSGKYLIHSLEHKFNGIEYQTIIEVIKDSSKLDLESEIKL
jgi:hypothetical protein